MTSATVKHKTDKVIAVFITVLIHALIFLFLLLFIIRSPIPPYPEPAGGPEFELDFGNNINGTGNVEANNIGNHTSEDNKVTQPTVTPPKSNTPPVVTNDAENSVSLPSGKATKAPAKVDTVKPQPQVNPELAGALNKFKNAKGDAGGNGNSGKQGNAGSPNGTTPGTGMGGGGGGETSTGNGLQFDLKGRKLLHRPEINSNKAIQGIIVVAITVDQAGVVTEAIPGVKGTTITDDNLYIKVTHAAMSTRFNSSPDGTPEQSGTITFVFTIQ